MVYIILDQDGIMLDVLNFESDEELQLYKSANPNHILKEEDAINTIDDPFNMYDEDLEEW